MVVIVGVVGVVRRDGVVVGIGVRHVVNGRKGKKIVEALNDTKVRGLFRVESEPFAGDTRMNNEWDGNNKDRRRRERRRGRRENRKQAKK